MSETGQRDDRSNSSVARASRSPLTTIIGLAVVFGSYLADISNAPMIEELFGEQGLRIATFIGSMIITLGPSILSILRRENSNNVSSDS